MTIWWILFGTFVAIVAVLLMATQAKDLYELFTGETWEERVEHLKTKNNEQRQKKSPEQGK